MYFLPFLFLSFAQDRTAEPQTEKTKKTFSVEVNSSNTIEELTQIEKMLKDEYNITLSFKDVKITDGKIVALKMKLQNGRQSFTRSVENVNVPIDAFTIRVEERGPQQYHVSIENQDAQGITSFMQHRNSGFFDSFADGLDTDADFSDINRQMDRMLKDMEATHQKFLQLFRELQHKPEAMNEAMTNKEASSAAITSGTD